MKKLVALLLTVLMLGGSVVPAFALETPAADLISAEQIPAQEELPDASFISNTGDEAEPVVSAAIKAPAETEPPAEEDPANNGSGNEGGETPGTGGQTDPETQTGEPAQETPAVSEKQLIEPQLEGSIPMVTVGGTGIDIYDANGEIVYDFPNIIGALATGNEEKLPNGFELKETLTTLLKSYVKYYMTFRRQKFYDELEAEIAKLSERIAMDENGNPRYGTGIGPEDTAKNLKNTTTPNPDGPFSFFTYIFTYDWRRSPLEIADELDAYIEAICEMTGHEQIVLSGRCLGANFASAYLTKYGYKNRILGFAYNVGMMHGQEALSEAISGKFSTDGNAILRYLTDMDVEMDDWVINLITFLENSHIFDTFNASVKSPIYASIVKGVTSALALSTLYTMPGYWSCVSNEDYDDAMLYVFGKPGSEKRQKYAGLIEKIEAYHNQVQLPMDDMLKRFVANGGKLAVVCKYGFQMMPMCDSRNDVADTFVSVHNASLGATTSKNYNTLSDDYIQSRLSLGLGKYISPDKKIDASTCLFPEYTWFIKNVVHDSYTDTEDSILYTVTTAQEQYTVDDLTTPQFLVKLDETDTIVPMTAENCNTEHWKSEDPSKLSFFERVSRFFTSLSALLRNLFDLIGK